VPVLNRLLRAAAAALASTTVGGTALAQAVAPPASAAAGAPDEPSDGLVRERPASGDAFVPDESAEGAFGEDDASADETTFFEQSDPAAESSPHLLEIYGFADFTYRHFLSGKDNQWRNLTSTDYPAFAVGNFNVYLSSRISERWRALGEVRFTYLPHGAQSFGPDGSLVYEDATVADYADLNRDTRVGALKIERAWLEFNANQYLNVRAGQWLTPYGLWIVDHGSPVIVPTQRPFVIGEQLFPERQTGIQVRGQAYLGDSTLEYVATVSNGRGTVDEYRDVDGNKALGGRVAFRTQPFGELTVGVSVYAGRFAEVSKMTRIETRSDGPDLVVDTHRDVDANELSYAADLRWNWGGLLVLGEVIANETRFEEGARMGLTAPDPAARQPDFRRWGGYVLLGYRTPRLGVMPFSTLQYLDPTNTDLLSSVWGGSFGVNIRPDPRVVLKGEYIGGLFNGVGSIGWRDPIRLFQAQVAWAF
jgi:hypothetical protein